MICRARQKMEIKAYHQKEESCTVSSSLFHRNLSHSRWDLNFWKIIRAINGTLDLTTRIDNWRVYGARCIAIRINILSSTERQIERRTRACIFIRFMFVSTAASTGSSVKNARFTVRLSREQVTRPRFGFVETGQAKRKGRGDCSMSSRILARFLRVRLTTET